MKRWKKEKEEDVNNVKDVKRFHGLGNKGRCSKSNTKKTYAKKRRYHAPKNHVNRKKLHLVPIKKIVDIDTNEASNKAELDGSQFLHLGVLERLHSLYMVMSGLL